MSDPSNFLDTGLGTPPVPSAISTPVDEPAAKTAAAPVETDVAEAHPALPGRMHPDDLAAILAAMEDRAPAPGAPPAPKKPKQLRKGQLVTYTSHGHYGRQEQLGITLHATDDDGRAAVAWFQGRSGPIPTADLEPFETED